MLSMIQGDEVAGGQTLTRGANIPLSYKDYYENLGLERSVTQDEIKRALRMLARKYHPGVNKEPDAAARFKEISDLLDQLDEMRARMRSRKRSCPPRSRNRRSMEHASAMERSAGQP